MIQIGVNQNVFLAQAEKSVNEETKLVSLALGFSEVGTEVKEKGKGSALDLLNDSSDSSGESNITKVVLFPPSIVYQFDDTKNDAYKKDDPRPGKDVLEDFITLKNQCVHLLKRFMPEKQVKFDLLAGINLGNSTQDQIVAAFAKEPVRNAVFNNLCNQLSKQAEPFIGDQTKPSRLFLTRSSQTNHFGTIRKKFLDRNPFFEDQNVSIPESKMFTEQKKGTTGLHPAIEVDGRKFVPNFSAWELQKGLDSGAVISDDEEGTAEGVTLEDATAGLSPELFTVTDDPEAGVTDVASETSGLSI